MNNTRNILGKPIENGVSVINAIKNRNDHLEISLQTWVDNPNIDEIIIVDWSSDSPVELIVNKFKAKKQIIILRVEGEDDWILSYAYNLAIQAASKNKILKLDADIKLTENFFQKFILKKDSFFTGRWELARDTNEIHLNGAIYAFREHLTKVQGYDERLTCYGWDDSDLYERLENNGLIRKNIYPDSLNHIPHDDTVRVKHQTISEEYKDNLLELTIKNRDLSLRRVPWGIKDDHELANFSIREMKPNYYSCIRRRAKLYVDVKGTLRERVRDYLIAKSIAEEGKRELFLIWQPNTKCEFKFLDLFKNNINVFDAFDMTLFKKSTEFFIFGNSNFSPQEINLHGNNDILIRASNGFLYENKTIKPLLRFPTELKQFIRKKFQKLIPLTDNKVIFDKNLIFDILKVSEPETPKVETFLRKKRQITISKNLNNFDFLIKSMTIELKNFITTNKLKSLVLGISGDVDSAVTAFLCRKVCREMKIPLMGRSFVIEDDNKKDIILAKMIGSLLCTRFQKVDLTTDYKVFCRGLKNENNLNIKNNTLEVKIRAANIKARIRMIYLYDLAQTKKGKVISTVNQTDFLTGLWTLHGDVGDFHLIQSLWKTEIYDLAKYLLKKRIQNIKERKAFTNCIKAMPRMGISINDFTQLKVKSYEEAEQIFKKYFSGQSQLHDHPLIERYKRNLFKQEQENVISRSSLLKTKELRI